MSESIVWALIVFGLLIIGVLLTYIRRQTASLKALKEEQVALQQQAEKKQASLQLNVVESIKVIATVMLDDQVELSEGCLRLKVLIDNFDPTLHEQDKFKVFAQMSEKLAHMPTHEARKKVEKKLIRKMDEERFRLEAEYREDIRQAATALIKWVERPLKSVE